MPIIDLTTLAVRKRTDPTWGCKIGVTGVHSLPGGCDLPMRVAVEAVFKSVVGVEAEFNFSGWGETLTPSERAVVDNVSPDIAKDAIYAANQLKESGLAPAVFEILKAEMDA